VKISGDVVGLSYEDLGKWLETLSTSFEHVMKRRGNGYAYVHFTTMADAALFLKSKGNGPISLCGRQNIRISTAVDRRETLPEDTSHNTEMDRINQNQIETVEENPDRIAQSESKQELLPEDDSYNTKKESKSKTTKFKQNVEIISHYSLRENDRTYVLVLLTPGIKESQQVKMEVWGDDRTISIIAEHSEHNEEELDYLIYNIPRRFELTMTLPKRIIGSNTAGITIKNGVATVRMRIQEIIGKRKIEWED